MANGGPVKGPFQYDSAVMVRGVSGCPELVPHDAEKLQSLSTASDYSFGVESISEKLLYDLASFKLSSPLPLVGVK